MSEGPDLADIVEVSRAVAGTSKRTEKTRALADLLRRLPANRVAPVVGVLAGKTPFAPLGIGPARIRAARPSVAAADSSLTLGDVEVGFQQIAAAEGTGSVGRKVKRLMALLESATSDEQAFLIGLCFGELRQGALAGIMADGIARAFDVPAAVVRRAAMLSGDLAHVAGLAAQEGEDALAAVGLSVLTPVEPMLASSGDDPTVALARHGRSILEWKLDGARIQVHKAGDQVRVFTRSLREATAVVPEVVEVVKALPVDDAVLDGEVIALRQSGRPYPFQVTMSRFGRAAPGASSRSARSTTAAGRTAPPEAALGEPSAAQAPPLTPFFFDLLHKNGETLVDLPLRDRLEALDAIVSVAYRVPRIESDDPELATAFLEETRARGHEGIMAKDPASTYQAGRRGKSWIKVKPANSLDLVVLAVERGSGRRRGWLSNIHLGARDPESGGFVMVGKTFKGMTDEVLRWQTETFPRFLEREEGHVLWLRPHFVAEIAFNEIQRSGRYPGGLALRFARLRGYRPDKKPEAADSIMTLRAMLDSMEGEQG